MLVDYLRGRMLAYLGYRAEHRARPGRRPGAPPGRRARPAPASGTSWATRRGTWRFAAIFERLAPLHRASGPPAVRCLTGPRWRSGRAPSSWHACEGPNRLVARTAVRMAAKRMFFDPSKAIRELGLPQTPVDEALRDAVDWFWANGYARRRRRV